MQSKRYISTLVIILSLFGVLSQQQVTIANQEIVLQFTNAQVTSEISKNTIAIVKSQLQDLGAENIKVKETESGTLKISYFSNVDLAIVKQTFSKEKQSVLDYTVNNQNKKSSEFPSDENPTNYNLDIYEIQNSNDLDWDLNGTLVAELKSDINRFSNPNIYAFIQTIDVNEHVEKTAFKIHYNIALAIDNTSHKIPEVRAGPIA